MTGDSSIWRSDVDPGIDGGWIVAANRLLRGGSAKYVVAVKSLFDDSRMADFCAGIDSQVRDAHCTGRMIGTLESWLDEERGAVLQYMGARGGKLPIENVGEIKRRRKRLAASVRRLATDLETEPEFKRVSLEQLLQWIIPPTGATRPHGKPVVRTIADDGRHDNRPRLLDIENSWRYKALDVFEPLARQLEYGLALTSGDRINPVPWAATKGLSQRTVLERSLCMQLQSLSRPGPIRFDLIALGVAIALSMPGVPRAKDVGRRWASFLAAQSA